MESRINYTIVGLFVVLLLTGLIVFAYWLGKYGYKQEHDYYRVYMTESVAGLSSDASVKYMGVEVGIVEQMGFNPENTEQVELLLKIKHGTPLKEGTTAALKFFGITGLGFIELKGGSNEAPLLKKTAHEIATIPTRLSTYARLNDSLTILAEKSAQVLDKIDHLLSDKNLQNIAVILFEMKMLAKDIRKQLGGFQRIVDSTISMETDISGAFEKVAAASVNVEKMAVTLEENYRDVGPDIGQNVRQSLESLNQLLYNLDTLAGDLQRTIRTIENSPSDILFKRSRPRPGPGEEGYREQ